MRDYWNGLDDIQKIHFESIALLVIIVICFAVIVLDQYLKNRKRVQKQKQHDDELEGYRHRCPHCHGPTIKTTTHSGDVLRICARQSRCASYHRF